MTGVTENTIVLYIQVCVPLTLTVWERKTRIEIQKEGERARKIEIESSWPH